MQYPTLGSHSKWQTSRQPVVDEEDSVAGGVVAEVAEGGGEEDGGGVEGRLKKKRYSFSVRKLIIKHQLHRYGHRILERSLIYCFRRLLNSGFL